MEEFLQMLTEPFYFVNDEGMREGTTHQVNYFFTFYIFCKIRKKNIN